MVKSEDKTSTMSNTFKRSTNMTATFTHQVNSLSEHEQSVVRGKLLMYSRNNADIRNNLENLKKSNPDYFDVLIDIIDLSLTELPVYDIDIPLNSLLSQFNKASFYNKEALNFTREVLKTVDKHTAKYYLAVLSYGILDNMNLKKQFQASVPFVKYIVNAVNSAEGLDRQRQFINAVKVLVNENADSNKIKLLPKIKYVLDSVSKSTYNLDITKIIYSSLSADDIEERLKWISSNTANFRREHSEINVSDYLIQNSL